MSIWSDPPSPFPGQPTFAVGGAEHRREYYRRYREQNREKRREYDRTKYALDPSMAKQRERKRYEKDFLKVALRNAKRRAAEQNLPFDISADDVVVPEFCPVLGLKLKVGRGRFDASSPSIDKIIPALGYVRGNVWVISNRANTLKNNATLQELELLTCALKEQLSKLATPSIPATAPSPEPSFPWMQPKAPWQ